LLCSALLAALAIVAAPALGAEPLPVYAGSLDFPVIESPAAPEEYSWQVDLAPGETLTQVSETEAEITRLTPLLVEEAIHAPDAYDLHGTPVPTSLTVTGDVVTLTVHHREASYAYPVTTITPEERDTAPLRDLDEGGMGFPMIQGPESPERYPFRVSLGEEQFLRQLSPTEVQVFNAGYSSARTIEAVKASAADGAKVPTTLEQTGRDVVTLVVHHRAGNPAAGGAPFDYPIIQGEGWEGGFFTGIVQMSNPNGEPAGTLTDEPSPSIRAAAWCMVPRLGGLDLRAAKARLRAAHCRVGAVHLAAGATVAKGKVVKQFHAAGTKLAAGASVAVKLGADASR
jgi:PASTA domain